MNRSIPTLILATLSLTAFAHAQFAPVNELGLGWGHLHLTAPDREKEVKAWLALGGRLGLNLSPNYPVLFPGLVVLIQQGPVTGGSEGSVVDHVAFRVPDLEAALADWRGPSVNRKVANWGFRFEPGTKPGQAFLYTPAQIKIEILEDKSLKVPIVFDHAHFHVEESRLRAMEDFYLTNFGAKPVKGAADTYTLPGGKLLFSKSDAATAPTSGRSLDHIGFNMLNAAALSAFCKTLEARGVQFKTPYRNTQLGDAVLLDGFGTAIEMNKGQAAYFGVKNIEPGYYGVDEKGNAR